MLFLLKYHSCTKCVLQSVRRQLHLNKIRFNNPKAAFNKDTKTELDKLIDKYQDKIVYNTVVDSLRPTSSFIKRKQLQTKEKSVQFQLQSREPLPLTLKYFIEDREEQKTDTKIKEEAEVKLTQFPFGDEGAVPISSTDNEAEIGGEHDEETIADSVDREVRQRQEIFKEGNYSRWMMDYENYEDTDENSETLPSWQINYGTPDPNAAVSKVPCGGCGALLHCKDTAIPGYIPSEIYHNSFKRGGVLLKALVCQRCHFLKNYNLALQVRVSSEDYPKVLETIKTKRALIVLMVDLLDFPCSVWPGIFDTLGTNKPIVIVGNKIDLFPRDSRGYLKRIEDTLKENVEMIVGKKAIKNIKHVTLISAKTGWGIEELITKLQNLWSAKNDVYLVGCTNVGKSSLFNCLIQSDFCKVQAVDLVQRATTSVWPGTTLNLLKFPILRPSGWRLYVRTKRLQSANRIKAEEEKFNTMQLKQTKDPKYATLIGHLDRTFPDDHSEEEERTDPFSVQGRSDTAGRSPVGIDERDPLFVASKWCYDTPGVVQPDQITHLLTTEELMLTIPREVIQPQSFSMRLGQTLFIAGIGRLDYIEGPPSVRITVFRAATLPITVCQTNDAEQLYKNLLGTDILQVPKGSEERLRSWPILQPSRPLRLTSQNKYQSCGDIVLSSAGWVAVTANAESEVTFTAWTPEARGIYLRKSFLPHAIELRGEKLRRSPAYNSHKLFVPK